MAIVRDENITISLEMSLRLSQKDLDAICLLDKSSAFDYLRYKFSKDGMPASFKQLMDILSELRD